MDRQDRYFTLPNILTYFRILLIPVFVVLFFRDFTIGALAVFVLASATDFLDGAIARRTGQVSRIGTLLDPLADKLMIMTALFCFVLRNWIPLWVLVVISGKELIMIVGGLFEWRKKNIVIPSNIIGKVATVLFMIAVVLTFFHDTLAPWHLYVLYAAVAASLAAIVSYAWLFLQRRK